MRAGDFFFFVHQGQSFMYFFHKLAGGRSLLCLLHTQVEICRFRDGWLSDFSDFLRRVFFSVRFPLARDLGERLLDPQRGQPGHGIPVPALARDLGEYS